MAEVLAKLVHSRETYSLTNEAVNDLVKYL